MVKKIISRNVVFWGVIIAMLVTNQASGLASQAPYERGVIVEPANSSTKPQILSPWSVSRFIDPHEYHRNTSGFTRFNSTKTSLPVGGYVSTGRSGGWMLTFSDEFDTDTLDLNKWSTEYGFDTYCVVDTPPPPGTPTYCNRSNNDEKEWYIDESPFVSGGTLKLVASKNDCSGDDLPDRSYAPYTCDNFPYLSSMVSTHGRFSQLYGYFEARIKIVNGQGFWPAFWLIPQLPPVPNPEVEYFWPPEIDIMENKGQEPNVIYLTHHYSGVFPEPGSKLNGWSYGGSVNRAFSGPDYSASFHTFAVQWQPGSIVWFVDGIKRFRSTYNIPPGTVYQPDYSGEMHIILNLAVGGLGVDHLLPPDELLPATMEVDYVRVYQFDSLPTAGFTSNTDVYLGETAIFTNTSIGAEPLSFLWDFGDTITSTLRNPTHEFAAPGSYLVTLTASNNTGSDSAWHDFIVIPSKPSQYLPGVWKK